MIGALRRASYERQVLVVYVVAIFMTVIDSTMVNVALPTMADEFGVRASDVEWIAVGYLLAVATVIPAAGWLGDRFGTKRIFLWSLAVFVSIQTAVYATTSHADTGRATSLFNTQRQISFALGTALAATVLAASLGDLGDDASAVERLAAHQHAFLAVGLIMVPGIFVSWRIRDEDAAETRGAAPVHT